MVFSEYAAKEEAIITAKAQRVRGNERLRKILGISIDERTAIAHTAGLETHCSGELKKPLLGVHYCWSMTKPLTCAYQKTKFSDDSQEELTPELYVCSIENPLGIGAIVLDDEYVDVHYTPEKKDLN